MGFRSKRKRNKQCQNLPTRPSPPPSKKQPTSFLTLPSELRQQILLNSFEGTWSCIACPNRLKRGHTLPCAYTQHAEFEDGEWRYRKAGWAGGMQPRHRGKMQATAWAEVLREIGYWVRDDVDVVDRLLSEEIERRWEEKNVNGKWCKVPTRAQGHGTAIEGCSQLYGGGK
ncbi:hypothetical protein Vi05172_g8246 [Venturia inaequalis]|nr:hypothetical protein Vi05172_g8246 [Venturia inaequalis]